MSISFCCLGIRRGNIVLLLLIISSFSTLENFETIVKLLDNVIDSFMEAHKFEVNKSHDSTSLFISLNNSSLSIVMQNVSISGNNR